MAAPSNDAFENALLITGTDGAAGAITIDDATTQSGEPFGSGLGTYYQTIWYKWVAPVTGSFSFNTGSSIATDLNGDSFGGLDTKMTIWTGTLLTSLTDIAHNDDVGGGHFTSLCNFSATSGTTYYIQVGTYGTPYTGFVILDWSQIATAPILLDYYGKQINASSDTAGVPVHEPGDLLMVYAGAQSDAATLTPSAGWTELSSMTITDHTSPWTSGAVFKTWWKVAEDYHDELTITKDTTRNGFALSMRISQADTSLLAVSTTNSYAPDTHFGTPPAITAPTTNAPMVIALVGHSDIMTVNSGPFNMNAWINRQFSGSNGTGLGGEFFINDYTSGSPAQAGQTFTPNNYTMVDNPAFAGTHYAPHVTQTVTVYAPVRTYTWQQGPHENQNGAAGQAAWDGGRYMYHLGIGASTTFNRYDIEENTLTSLTPPSQSRAYHASTVVDGKVYVIAGQDGVNETLKTVPTRVYDIATDSWSTVSSMPAFVVGYLVNDILAGDTVFQVNETTTMVIDPPASGATIWMNNESLKITARTHISGSVYQWTVNRAQGATSAAGYSAGQEVNGGANSGGTPGGYLFYPYAVEHEGQIYVFGGFGSGSNEPVDNAFYRYNPNNDTWHQLDIVPAGQDFGAGAIAGDGKLHLLGTNIDGVDNNHQVWSNGVSGLQQMAHQVYDFQAQSWSIRDNIPAPDDRGRVAEFNQSVVFYDPVTDELVAIPWQNTGGFYSGVGSNGYANDKFVYRYNVTGRYWSTDNDIDYPYVGLFFDASSSGVYGTRRVLVFTDTNSSNFPGILYYDLPVTTSGWELLSSVYSDPRPVVQEPQGLPTPIMPDARALDSGDKFVYEKHQHGLETYANNPMPFGTTASPGTPGIAPSRGSHVHPNIGIDVDIQQLIVSKDVQLQGDVTATISADQDNFDPSGLNDVGYPAAVLRISNISAVTQTITGLVGGADGRLLFIHNIGPRSFIIKDEGLTSSPQNRFALIQDMPMNPDMMTLFQYDATSQRWRALGGGGTSGTTRGFAFFARFVS